MQIQVIECPSFCDSIPNKVLRKFKICVLFSVCICNMSCNMQLMFVILSFVIWRTNVASSLALNIVLWSTTSGEQGNMTLDYSSCISIAKKHQNHFGSLWFFPCFTTTMSILGAWSLFCSHLSFKLPIP
jgi:hypothetical protein